MVAWIKPRLLAVLDAWLKFLADATATRNLIALPVILLVIKAFSKGIEVAKTTSDIAVLLNAISSIAMVSFGVWLAAKTITPITNKESTWTSSVASNRSLSESSEESETENSLPTEEPWRTREENGLQD